MTSPLIIGRRPETSCPVAVRALRTLAWLSANWAAALHLCQWTMYEIGFPVCSWKVSRAGLSRVAARWKLKLYGGHGFKGDPHGGGRLCNEKVRVAEPARQFSRATIETGRCIPRGRRVPQAESVTATTTTRQFRLEIKEKRRPVEGEGVARPRFLRSRPEWKLWGWIWSVDAGEGNAQRKIMEDEEPRARAPIVPGVSTYRRLYGRAVARRFRPDNAATYAWTELLEKDERWLVMISIRRNHFNGRCFRLVASPLTAPRLSHTRAGILRGGIAVSRQSGYNCFATAAT